MFYKMKLKNLKNPKGTSEDILEKRTAMWKPILLILPALIVIILFIVVPFITAANDSLHSTPNPNLPFEKNFGTESFKILFEDKNFKTALSNSMLYAIISIPLIMIISLVISSAISTLLRKKLKGFWQTIFFLPYVTSAIAIGLTFSYIFDFDKGLINKLFNIKVPWLNDIHGHTSLWSMLIYGVWKGLAFNILIFTTAMLGVDKKLYKSASIDGAGPIKQFFTITMPSIKSTLSFLFTMGLIASIKVFPLALFQNDSELATKNNGSTLLLYIYNQLITNKNYSLAGAASVVLVGVSIAFTIFVKTFVKGITIGTMKVGEYRVQTKIEASNQIK